MAYATIFMWVRGTVRGMHATKTQHIRALVVAVVFFACASAASAQMVLEVIPLKHRTVEEVIPVL